MPFWVKTKLPSIQLAIKFSTRANWVLVHTYILKLTKDKEQTFSQKSIPEHAVYELEYDRTQLNK